MDTNCDYCDKKPVANYQRVWVRWSIRERNYSSKYKYSEEMNDMDEPDGENNIHVCKEHEEDLLNGDIG